MRQPLRTPLLPTMRPRLTKRETMRVMLSLKTMAKKPRLRAVMLLLRVPKRPLQSELQTVRTHQMNENIYLHVSRLKFGMVMQIHCK